MSILEQSCSCFLLNGLTLKWVLAILDEFDWVFRLSQINLNTKFYIFTLLEYPNVSCSANSSVSLEFVTIAGRRVGRPVFKIANR